MTFTLFSGRVVRGYVAAAMLACGPAQGTALINSSYDVARELFAALNSGFNRAMAAGASRRHADHSSVARRIVPAGAGYPNRGFRRMW